MTAPLPGVRTTRQRTAVADLLGRVDGFRSAQELHDLLRQDGASVGLTTVYRHLQALADQLGFKYARLSELASLSETLRDRQFARRRPTPTDLYWLPAALAVLLLVVRFQPDLKAARR